MPTIPDVELKGRSYQSLYTDSGITLGVPVVLQNKSSSIIYVQNTEDKPDARSKAGFVLLPYEATPVTGQIRNLWAMGTGPVLIEEIL